MFGYYGGYGSYYTADRTYMFWQILLILVPFLICLGAQILVKSRYKKYAAIRNKRGLSGAQAAYEVLRANGITDVKIEEVNGNLTDHYDPRANAIRLSTDVYHSASIAAVGIACHEAGHACQYAQSYAPIKLRKAVIPMANIGSSIGMPLCIIGIIFSSMNFLFYVGIILYSLVLLFQFITLPVEFNASKRALQTIEQYGLLGIDEYRGAKAVLSAAALTYVASMASTLLTIIRLLLIGSRRR